jgi:hypothetical protein
VIALVPQVNVYNSLGQDCVSAGCSVDLFVFNNSYIDVATIGQVSRLSGGEIYKYTYFQVNELLLRNLRDRERAHGCVHICARFSAFMGNKYTEIVGGQALFRVWLKANILETCCLHHWGTI